MLDRTAFPSSANLPYDRSRVTPGIVHLGVGAFCRAHMAVYIDGLLAIDPSWGIIGASLRRPDTRIALAPQDFLYTLAVRGRSGTAVRTIGSLLDILHARTQRDELIAAMTDPRIRIVSLTITENGYCHDPATGALDPHHPDVVHDLAYPGAPVSAAGLILRAIELRRAAGITPFTVLSCDNLPANGETTARILTDLAALRDTSLADYIARAVSFPSSMVDRIVPATTDADRSMVLGATALRDAWPVVTEPFSQWIVEDRFSSGRPPLDRVGVEFVADVRPFEPMKLRMLNGSHSAMAYLGYLAGYELISEVIADPDFRALVHAFMTEEVMGTLHPGLGDLSGYRDALLERFANPALKHRTWQIAMDGSQKLPQRLLGTIRDRLAAGQPFERAALGVAAWIRYATGLDEQRREIRVSDPLSYRLRCIADASCGVPARLVDGFLGLTEVFGDDLPRSGPLRAALVGHVTALFRLGAQESVRRLVLAK